MSLLQVERSSLDAVLIAVSAAYEALEDYAEYKVAFGEAHTIPVNEKARIRDKAGEAIDTLQYLLREALEAPNAQHPDDIAVDKFAAAMKAKMAKQRARGYSGWDDKEDCPTERLQQMLMDHIAKGDPVDVGNFAMMLWNRGEDTAAPKALAPLTDEQIYNVFAATVEDAEPFAELVGDPIWAEVVEITRAIEAAHGIHAKGGQQ